MIKYKYILLVFILSVSNGYTQNLVPNPSFEFYTTTENAKNSFGFNEEIAVKTTESTEKAGPSYNLVPNYSFEDYSSCPTASSQINLATPWYGTNNSTEYLNACVPTCTPLSVPCQDSTLSYQPARTGVAFAALWMLNGYGGDYREYLQTQLLDTLLPLTCYKVTFYANRLDAVIMYAVNNFGIHLSNNSYTTTWGPPPYTPQILGFNNEVINDTVNWIEISGIYVANGGEQYITIGNFSDDANTDTINTGNGTYSGAYYYFDDVSVLPIDSIPGGMPAYAGADTNVILGDSVFIGQQISNLNCNWYNAIGGLIASGTSGIYVSPTTTTTFVVEQELCGTITYDTVKVSVTTSINELFNENNVQIYPNPTTGETTLEIVGGESNEWRMAVLDVQGRTVVEKLFNGNKIKLKLALDNGVYLVRITNKNTNETLVKKLVIQK